MPALLLSLLARPKLMLAGLAVTFLLVVMIMIYSRGRHDADQAHAVRDAAGTLQAVEARRAGEGVAAASDDPADELRRRGALRSD